MRSATLPLNCSVITACFVCVCGIIVIFSRADDEVGAVFDNNTDMKQQEDGANEGEAPLGCFNWRGLMLDGPWRSRQQALTY